MKTKQFINKGILLFCTFLILSSSQVIFAKTAKDYTHLAESGTAQEIEDALKSTSGLQNQAFGTNKETLLMIALKNNRDLDIINLFIKYGSKVKSKAKDKRTPIMFASRFTTNPEILDLVIQSSAMTKGGKEKAVLEKDKDGKTAFDYASKNPTAGVYEVLTKYANDPMQKETENVASEATIPTAKTADESSKTNNADESSKSNAENNKTSSSMHTVTATFVPSPKKEKEPEQTNDDSSKAEQSASIKEESASATSENKTSDVQTISSTSSTKQTEVQAKPAEATQTVPESISTNSSNKNNANSIETKNYEKSYLSDYMNDTTPTTPEKEKPSTTEITIDNVNKTDKNGVTLLMKAAKAGNDWDIQNLLNNGADVQLRDKDGWSALMYAVRYQNSIRLVNMLIEKGAHTRIRNKYNATPLLLAADYTQNPQILSLLLRNRSTSEDEVFKAFILSLTSNEGSEHIQVTKIQLFLNMGISVNRVWKGKTPLMYACQYTNSSAVLQLLLDSGANPGTQNVEGKTAFDYAKENTRLVHDDVYWSLNSVEK